jgi:regulator of sigma E protease
VVHDQQTGSKIQVKGGKTIGTQRFNASIAEVHPGTRFTFNWLPLGGFVRPKGENDPNVKGGLAAASPWKRLVVLFAGPLMNLIAAVLIYSFIVTRIGAYDINRVLVSGVAPESPAEASGMLGGDIFVSADGEPISSVEDLSKVVGANQDQPITFIMDRDGQQLELIATPRMNTEENRPMIGVSLSTPHLEISSSAEALQWGSRYTYYNIRALLALPAKLIRGQLEPEQSRMVGLKGIYDIMEYSVEQGKEASAAAPVSAPFDWYIPTLEIVAALSISLGIFNLFPFPALDGGRIIFVLPEMIFRRRVPHQFENLVHGLGMTVLLLFMIYVNVMDFINPLNLP